VTRGVHLPVSTAKPKLSPRRESASMVKCPRPLEDNIFVKQHRTSQPRDVCLLCDRLGPSLCEVEDHPGRHVTMLQPVQDFIDRRQGLQLDVSFHLAFRGEAQRFGHIVTRSDE